MTAPVYLRSELIAICQRSFVPESKWTNRDSADAQIQAGQCLALLSAGCEFEILDGESLERNTFYLPTIARLDSIGRGNDWY